LWVSGVLPFKSKLNITVRSGQVYPVLARSLEEWRARPLSVLAALIGAPAEVGELQIDGELVRLETSVKWADEKHSTYFVEAVAYGPASWQTERVTEKLRIEAKPHGGHDV
jgi:hypothetical protein